MSAVAPHRLSAGAGPFAAFAPQDAYAAQTGDPLQAKPFGALNFWVTARRDGGAAAAYDPPITLEMMRSPSGLYLFYNAVPGRDGVRRQPYFTAGRFDMRIEADYYQPVKLLDVALPSGREPLSVSLKPGYRYPFPAARDPKNGGPPTLLRGSVLAADGSGIADAVVALDGGDKDAGYLTDGSGQFALLIPQARAGATVSLVVTRPGAAPVQLEDIEIKAGPNNSLPLSRLRGRLADPSGRAFVGALVRVEGLDGATLSGPNGDWVYSFPLGQRRRKVKLRAELPDGTAIDLPSAELLPGETVTLPDSTNSGEPN